MHGHRNTEDHIMYYSPREISAAKACWKRAKVRADQLTQSANATPDDAVAACEANHARFYAYSEREEFFAMLRGERVASICV